MSTQATGYSSDTGDKTFSLFDDEMLPWTSNPRKILPIQYGTAKPQSYRARTIFDVFERTVRKYPEKVCYRFEEGGEKKKVTWNQYYFDVKGFAKSCIQIGVEPKRGVAIQGFNSYQWMVANVGAIFARTISTGVYPSNTPDASKYTANLADAQVIVVESEEQLEKYLTDEGEEELSCDLKAFVVWGELTKNYDLPVPVLKWDEFMRVGAFISDRRLLRRTADTNPGECCSIIPTSGTTGAPKGVMLSHDNITWTARVVSRMFKINHNDRLISYLPLSHIAAQMLDIHAPMAKGCEVTIAKPDALRGSLVQTLQEARPTLFLGVPRVWEKVMEKMQEAGRQVGFVKRKIAMWAKAKGLEGARREREGRSKPAFYGLANKLVFSKVKKRLGLDKARITVSGAAPISPETLDYFNSLGFRILDLYGMSESSGPQTVSLPDAYRMGSAGKAMPGTEIKIADDGEICFKGRNIFMGYINNDEKTAETFDFDGWLRSGDMGHIDADGYLHITGRKKELIVTAGGENVAPVAIEQRIKEELPCISQVMVIGDKRRFLSCLITLRTDPEREGMLAADVAAELGVRTVDEASRSIHVLTHLQKGIYRANEKAVSNAQKVQKLRIVPEFTVENELLTPSMKLKRAVVERVYDELIDEIYRE